MCLGFHACRARTGRTYRDFGWPSGPHAAAHPTPPLRSILLADRLAMEAGSRQLTRVACAPASGAESHRPQREGAPGRVFLLSGHRSSCIGETTRDAYGRYGSRWPDRLRCPVSGARGAKGRMRCASCGSTNPDGAKFCIECAAPLGRLCPRCGFENLPQAKFCAECGTSLVVRPKADDRRREVGAERIPGAKGSAASSP